MSLGSRIAVGAVALLCAAGFFMTALDPSGLPAGALVFYGMAGFCIVIAIACVFPQSHPVTLRLIGAIIFLAYVSDSFHTQNLGRAFVGFLVWGIPSGYLAVMGKYPSWGKGSEGFTGKRKKISHS
jgi:asparagine N-glycosylation enzyme membrane subunit Stt3